MKPKKILNFKKHNPNHLMGSLLLVDNEGSKFAQLYIFYMENEVANRSKPFCHEDSSSTLNDVVVIGLMNMLNSFNKLVCLFRHSKQRLNNVNVPSFKLHLIG